MAAGLMRRTRTTNLIDLTAVAAVLAALAVVSVRTWRGVETPAGGVTVLLALAGGISAG
jgi:hypothetical protein